MRKEKNITQEQLAEKLFVSRTAISKWETGRGFPNLDSLKNIASIFSISIDDLLSGEELITIAEKENKRNITNIYYFIFYFMDMMMLLLLFLPIFGIQEGNVIRSVNIWSVTSASSFTKAFYFLLISLSITAGSVGIISYFRSREWRYRYKISSAFVFILAVVAFLLSQQPYPALISFVLLLIKFLAMAKAKEG